MLIMCSVPPASTTCRVAEPHDLRRAHHRLHAADAHALLIGERGHRVGEPGAAHDLPREVGSVAGLARVAEHRPRPRRRRARRCCSSAPRAATAAQLARRSTPRARRRSCRSACALHPPGRRAASPFRISSSWTETRASAFVATRARGGPPELGGRDGPLAQADATGTCSGGRGGRCQAAARRTVGSRRVRAGTGRAGTGRSVRARRERARPACTGRTIGTRRERPVGTWRERARTGQARLPAAGPVAA